MPDVLDVIFGEDETISGGHPLAICFGDESVAGKLKLAEPSHTGNSLGNERIRKIGDPKCVRISIESP